MWKPAMKTSGQVAGWGLVLAPWQCPTQTAFSILQCLAKKRNGGCVPPPLYSPDLTPCNLFLYPQMKQVWKGGIPLILQRFNETRWWPLMAFQLKTTMFAAVGAELGWLHSVIGAVLWRELKFQTCINILNKYFVTIPEILGSPLLYGHYFT